MGERRGLHVGGTLPFITRSVYVAGSLSAPCPRASSPGGGTHVVPVLLGLTLTLGSVPSLQTTPDTKKTPTLAVPAGRDKEGLVPG